MGIAMASGVPAEKGLITGIIGGIVVGALAGSPLQVSGPAAGLAVIVFEIVQKHGPVGMLGPLLLLAGLIQIVAGALRLGQWFRAISPAVVHGMLAGIGVLIVVGQIHVLFGDKPGPHGLQNLPPFPRGLRRAWSRRPPWAQAESAFLVGRRSPSRRWSPGRRSGPSSLKLVPGALHRRHGRRQLLAWMAFFGLDVQRIAVPDSIVAAIALAAGGRHSRLLEPQPAMIVTALAIAFIASRRDPAVGGRGRPDARRPAHPSYNKELFAQGRRQHAVRRSPAPCR
jgi:hypothetical protein